jgi:hypothetical protein
MMMPSHQLFLTTISSYSDPLDCAVECGDDDERHQYADLLWSPSLSIDSMTNALEGVYCKQAAASIVQPHSESKTSFGQPSMECTDDSTRGAKKKCIQFPWKLHEMLDNADVEGFSDIVSWLPGSTNSFKVHQPGVFVEGIIW